MNKSHLRLSLLSQFSIVGFVITLAVAITLGYALQQQIVRVALEQEAASAVDEVQSNISPNMQAVDFDGMNPKRLAELDAQIRGHVLSRHIVRLKIWNKQGVVLYSEDSSLIGNQLPLSDELEQAFDGKVAMEVSDLAKPENISERGGQERLFEIYVPLHPRDRNEILGAFEIYHDYNVIKPYVDSMTGLLYGGLGIGFFILYFSLFAIVRRASRELIRRSEENVRLFEAEQSRREELGTLYDLSRRLVEADSVNAIAELVVQHAVPTIHATFARILLQDNDELVTRATHPIRYLDRDLGMGAHQKITTLPFTQRVLAEKRTVVIAANSSDFNDTERAALFLGIAQNLCLVPLSIGDQTIGLFMLGESRSEQREPFTPEKLRLAASIGEQAATAIHRALLRERNAQLYERTRHQAESLQQLAAQLELTYNATLAAMSAALDARDRETEGHSQRVTRLTCEIARAMGGFDVDEMAAIERGALLHDIGKIGVSDTILLKPGPLTMEEWREMKKHPEIGARIIEGIDFLQSATPIVYYHQERWNGTGYPLGLKGDAIPLTARIFAVVDVFDALTSDRPYRRAWDRARAAEYILAASGIEFDPRVVDEFLRVVALCVPLPVLAE